MKLAILMLLAVIPASPGEIVYTTPAIPIYTVPPQYTKEALAAKIEGDVTLSLTVGTDGVPSEIKVVRGLDMGLDEKAVEGVQQWRYKAAINYFREPEATKITVIVNFRLLHPSKAK